MNDVPLIQSVDLNAINTSIIAIKKQLKQINEVLGLIDVPDAQDLSPYVKKTDIVDVIESGNMNPVTSNAVATSNAMPVDTVTSGNMHSVTSNAVASELLSVKYGDVSSYYNFYAKSIKKIGRVVYLQLELYVSQQDVSRNTFVSIATLPVGYRPLKRIGMTVPNVNASTGFLIDNWACTISEAGNITVYTTSNFSFVYINVVYVSDS